MLFLLPEGSGFEQLRFIYEVKDKIDGDVFVHDIDSTAADVFDVYYNGKVYDREKRRISGICFFRSGQDNDHRYKAFFGRTNAGI